MKQTLATLVGLMWAAVLLGGAFRPQAPAAGVAAAAPRVGYPAPALAALDLEGRPVSLEQYRGKAVFVNFWASWCGPCRLEMPEVQRLAEALPEGTAVLTVNMTAQESSPDAVRAYLQQGGFTFPVAMDPSGKAGDTYQVLSLPTSVFVSPDGIITTRINGPLTHRAMLDYLKAAGR